jgi:hypothetical protein
MSVEDAVETIRDHLEKLGWSQSELARKAKKQGLKISRVTINKLLKGRIPVPKLDTLDKLEKLLGYSLFDRVSNRDSAKDKEPKPPSSYMPGMVTTPPEKVLRDHIGLWCARCLGYLEPREIGHYFPYDRLPSVDDPILQVDLERVLGWDVPVHRHGCPSAVVDLDVEAAGGWLNSLLLSPPWKLENAANTLFYRGNLNVNMWIRLILSQRCLNNEYKQGAAAEIARATISNGGSNRSEIIGPILDRRMPSVLNRLPRQIIQVSLAKGNRARNIGNPNLAEKVYYGQARDILSKQPQNKKGRHALKRRELSVSPKCASSDEAKGMIEDAIEDAEQYGVLTTRNYIGLDNLRKNDYVQAETSFREMVNFFDDQKPNTIVSWWHIMAGWLGLGATLYASDQSKREEALGYCLKSEYISALLGLQVDVTRGISEQLLGHHTLLSPSAVVKKIGGEEGVKPEKMVEIRRTALIDSGLQQDLLAELNGTSLGFIR